MAPFERSPLSREGERTRPRFAPAPSGSVCLRPRRHASGPLLGCGLALGASALAATRDEPHLVGRRGPTLLALNQSLQILQEGGEVWSRCLIIDVGSFPSAGNEVPPSQFSEVLGYRSLGEANGGLDMADARLANGEQHEDVEPDGVRERLKDMGLGAHGGGFHETSWHIQFFACILIPLSPGGE